MASVYILHSTKLDHSYIGSCRDLPYRLKQHQEKLFPKSFTAKADDWNLFLSIDDLEYQQAIAIEKHLKEMKSKTYIQNLKKYPEIETKLVEQYK
ncbi:GIY-YIG nuclease family protein [Pedobacter sp. BS3]|uniref:GIY-YIG nuclease family protein n=1 Tax=Pedobacter sp. BS3 TaxID=2567937 RepID=UPI0011EF53E3|nr:GIY-YIG nuclease family protein [Pedobacter sp. BS3]TZF84952.1 GIY-YIG nuclease family protein [Pedobacter sp. BS3]